MANRNDENKYGEVDTIECPRSHWNRHWKHTTTCNAGVLVPHLLDMDIIPGTTIKHKTSLVVRMQTPLDPVMDNCYIDTFYFKCSKFWYWEHFRAMMGENKLGAWAQEIEYKEPMIKTTSTRKAQVNDLMTYYGVRYNTANLAFSKIAVNAYIDIWNNWFRDQNLMAPIEYDITDTDLEADGTINTGCGLLPVCKFHDYFTSCLPEPQKGTAVNIPLATEAPVKGNGVSTEWVREGVSASTSWAGSASGFVPAVAFPSTGSVSITTNSQKSGLVADLAAATAATINALRLSFATQRILEKDARFGTRYREILRGHYAVTASDESLLTPEYLGGERIPINIQTVLQNSSTDSTSPLGYTGAFSVTTSLHHDFTKSFTKDDILIGLMCIRADHSYQQGIPRQLTRSKRLDRYWPALAHIGNQPVYNYEIFAQGTKTDNEVFGYKEAWQEYMYKNNMISGEMLSEYEKSLDIWHYADDYNSLPVLSAEWIKEPLTNIDRTLAVKSSENNQFLVDFYYDQDVVAPIPLNRVPGLIDHF